MSPWRLGTHYNGRCCFDYGNSENSVVAKNESLGACGRAFLQLSGPKCQVLFVLGAVGTVHTDTRASLRERQRRGWASTAKLVLARRLPVCARRRGHDGGHLFRV